MRWPKASYSTPFFSKISLIIAVLALATFSALIQPSHALAAACPFVDGQAPDSDGNATNNVILINGPYTITADATNQGNFDCSAYTINMSVGAVLTLASYSNPGDGTFYGVNLTVNNLYMNGGKITADGQGWAGGAANQDGQGPGKGLGASGINSGNAGGYGGRGNLYADGGATYGDPFQPIDLGSGGGGADSLAGGAGGGAIKITSNNAMYLNSGSIEANGADATLNGGGPYVCSGAGAGGSIWLDAGTSSASLGFKISALGGSAINMNCNSTGGGGRIYMGHAVYLALTSSNDLVKIMNALPYVVANAGTTTQGSYTTVGGFGAGLGTLLPDPVSFHNDAQFASDGVTPISLGGTAPANYVQFASSLKYTDPEPMGIQSTSTIQHSLSNTTQTVMNLSDSIKGNQNVLIAVHAAYEGTETISGITYNDQGSRTQNFTKGCSSSVNGINNDIWYLVAPDPLSTTISVNFTGAGATKVGIQASNFINVNQSTPVASSACNQSSSASTTPSVNLSLTGTQVAFGGVAIHTNATLTPDAASYKLDSFSGSDFTEYSSVKLTGTNMSWVSPNSADWATSALVLNSSVNEPNPNYFLYYWQMEVKPVGTNFTNSFTSYKTISFNGSNGEFANQVTLSQTGSYHAQARICDTSYTCSSWAPYGYTPGVGYNAESSADFVINNINTPPNSPTSLGPAESISGISSNNSQPLFNFSLSDPNGSDQVGYEVEVASSSNINSDGTYINPLVDYLSPVSAQGANSFTVGQAAGGGTYLVGSEAQHLDPNSYYWQVRTIDQWGAKSSFQYSVSFPPFIVTNVLPTVSSLGPSTLTDGSANYNTQPAFTFTTGDQDGQLQYEIQVASDSAFTTPAVDYTSALGTPGAQTFTVGQAVGSGTYTLGSYAQTLAPGSYYWRVKVTDQYGLASDYSAANSGAVAFQALYQAPHACPFIDGVNPDADGNANNNSILITSHYTVHANTYNQGNFDCSAYDITVGNGGILTFASYSDPTSGTFYGVTMSVNNLTVNNGGKISANGQGWAGGAAAADGYGPGKGLGGSGHLGGGGGYGDHGGENGLGGITYGDPYSPVDLGSGGGGASGLAGAAGGGAIKLIASGVLTVNGGTISADGLAGSSTGSNPNMVCSGSGAGGSIWLVAPTFSFIHNSSVSAKGGTAIGLSGNCNSGGGGGRVRFSSFSSQFANVNDGYEGGLQQHGSVWPQPAQLNFNDGQYNGDGLTSIYTGGPASTGTVLFRSNLSSDYYFPNAFLNNPTLNTNTMSDPGSPSTTTSVTTSVLGSDREMMAVYVAYQGSETASDVTINDPHSTTQNLIKACSSTVNDLHSEIWYVLKPNVEGGFGSYQSTITASFTGAGVSHSALEVMDFPNVDQSNPIARANCNQGTSSTPSVSTPIGPSQIAYGGAVDDFTTALGTDARSQDFDDQIGTTLADNVSVKTQGSSMNWTLSSSGNWATSAIVVNSADALQSTQYHYQVEVQPNGTGFTDTATLTLPFYYNGVTGDFAFPYTAPTSGSYVWQARVCDANDANCSSWQSHGGNPDFVVSNADTPPNDPANLGPSNLTDGSTGTNNQPTFNFDLSASDNSLQMGYEIQVASDSAFLTPAIDYVSSLEAQGTPNFTVGQDPGTGYYTIGKIGQTLADGQYYWRVMGIDQNSTLSNFVFANAGAVAFQLGSGGGGGGADTTPPVLSFTSSATGDVLANQVQYVGTATDDVAMASVEYAVDGGSRQNANPDTSNPASYPFSIDLTSLNLGLGAHTIDIYADDTSANETHQSFSINVVTVMPPQLTFSASASGLVKNPLFYQGISTASAGLTMSNVQYAVDGGGQQDVTVDTNQSTSTTTFFTADLSGLSDGAHSVVFTATDSNSATSTQSFTLDVDNTPPSCTAGWYNQTIPYFSKILHYTNIHCTSAHKIVSGQFSLYHVVYGTIQNPQTVTPVSGAGTGDATFNFTVDMTSLTTNNGNLNGVVLVGFAAIDEAGNQSNDYDPVTLEATDDNPPTVNLDKVLPNPTTDTSPTVSGSCSDQTPGVLNTNISNMNYSLDGGSNTDIVPLFGGTYHDAVTKSFAVKLPTQAVGDHTVTVHCTDGNANTSSATDTFTIQAPVSPAPGTFTFTEGFNSNLNQDLANTNNMVWGNGHLRLKENITNTRTLVDTVTDCSRYGTCYGDRGVWQDPVDSHLIWYYLNSHLHTYNTQTQVNTVFDIAGSYGGFGVSDISSQLQGFAIGVLNGKEYLWISDPYSIKVFDLTDHTAFEKGGFGYGAITLDFARGRLAAYMSINASAGNTNLAYYDLNGTMDQTDDVLTLIPLTALPSTGYISLLVNPTTNKIYAGAYADGLYEWDDHNAPANTAGYTINQHYNDGNYQSIFSMTLDPQNHVLFGTANNSNGRLYAIETDGGTPVLFATPQQLGYRNIYGIQYVTGQNGVGDQLILTTETGNPIYLNINSNYDVMTDKTFIDLVADGGIRPGRVVPLLSDYNTVYVNVSNQGFYRLDLNRGWASSGDAVALPTRPPQALIVNNFVANANPGGTIAAYIPSQGKQQNLMASLSRALIPQAQASNGDGITYFVSTDSGLTWTQMTLGQLQQLQQNDYRVKFRISMTPVNGATPVLDSYSLAYAGYQNPVQLNTTVGLGVSPNTDTPSLGSNFNLTVQGVDGLGFLTPTYTGHINISLVDPNSFSTVGGLSASTADITSGGTITLSGVHINNLGTFKIKVTDGNFTNYSNPITVTQGSNLTQPTISFWGDKYTITAGQSVALHWSSTNVTSWVIQPGNLTETSANGNYLVTPTQTTGYTITGNGSNGSVSSSLTITVLPGNGGNGNGSGSGNGSGNPTASSSGTASSSAGTSSGSPSGSGLGDLIITGTQDQTIVKGEKASVAWSVADADQVTVDYPTPHQVGLSGSFEFYPTSTVAITISATKNQISSHKVITITVLDAPLPVQQFVKGLQVTFPALLPLMNVTFQSSQTIPKVGLGAAVAVEALLMTLLASSVASQLGFAALLNGKTLLNFLSSLGIFPAKQRKGFVHRTKTGEAIPFALISVYANEQAGAVRNQLPLMTLVSDVYGVYNDPYLAAGKYHFAVAQGDHAFPTQLSRPLHLSLKDFYKGEELSVVSNKERSAVLIPMDEVAISQHKHVLRTKLMLGLNRTLNALQWLVYPFTFLAVLAVIISPNIFNVVILAIYALILIPKLLKALRRPVLQGQVTANQNRQPVVNATVTLSTPTGVMVALSKTDRTGKFAFYAPKGEYALNVLSDNLIWNETPVGTLYTVKAQGAQTKPLKLTMSKIENPFG